MFICEIWLFDLYVPQFCKSDMSKYRYLEVYQRVPSTSRYRESTVPEICQYFNLKKREASTKSISVFGNKVVKH